MADEPNATSNESFIIASKSLRSFLKDLPSSILEGLTGLVGAERREIVYTLGHMLQRSRNLNFFQVFVDEWNEFRKKGRIKQDYESSEQHWDCLQEMLDFLDKELPSRERFEVMKKIFLVSVTEAALNRDSQLPGEYMRLCRRMSSGELRVLVAAYRVLTRETAWKDMNTTARAWLERVAEVSGLEFASLVESYESGLMEKRLITDRRGRDGGLIFLKQFRLTSLAVAFCEYMLTYDTLAGDRD